MCVPYRQLDPKSRLILGIGNFSLVAGLLLRLFVHPSSQIEQNWLHGVCGLMLGLSIAINLSAFRFARRCRESQT